MSILWFFGAAIAASAVAAWIDWRTGHIPNWLTFGVIAASPFAHVFFTLAKTGNRLDAGQEGALSVFGGLLCAALPVGLFRASALGGGDVKLFVAIGALLMPIAGLEAELWSFCAAATLAPLRLAWDGKLFRTVGNAAYIVANPFLPKERRRDLDRETVSWFRMGPAVLVGTIWTTYQHLHD